VDNDYFPVARKQSKLKKAPYTGQVAIYMKSNRTCFSQSVNKELSTIFCFNMDAQTAGKVKNKLLQNNVSNRWLGG